MSNAVANPPGRASVVRAPLRQSTGLVLPALPAMSPARLIATGSKYVPSGVKTPSFQMNAEKSPMLGPPFQPATTPASLIAVASPNGAVGWAAKCVGMITVVVGSGTRAAFGEPGVGETGAVARSGLQAATRNTAAVTNDARTRTRALWGRMVSSELKRSTAECTVGFLRTRSRPRGVQR